MKFNEWIKIREQAPITPISQGATKPPQPGEKARKTKTATAIRGTLAKVVGKPAQVQIKALQSTAQKLATDPGADDDAIADVDKEVKRIQGQAGIKA